jgi:hypothetical protein
MEGEITGDGLLLLYASFVRTHHHPPTPMIATSVSPFKPRSRTDVREKR